MVRVYIVEALVPIFDDKINNLVLDPREAEVLCYLISEDFNEEDEEYQTLKALISPEVHFVVVVEKNEYRNIIPHDLKYDCCYNTRSKKKLEELIEKLNSENWAVSDSVKKGKVQKLKEYVETEKKRIEEESKRLEEAKETQEEQLRREKERIRAIQEEQLRRLQESQKIQEEQLLSDRRRLQEERESAFVRLREESSRLEAGRQQQKEEWRQLEKAKKDEEEWLHNEKLRLASEEQKGDNCAVCMNASISAIFHPCNHACCCYDCALTLLTKPCPMCRKVTTKLDPVFIAGS